MADDTQTTVLGGDIPIKTFNATADGSGHLTMQSTPRTNGAEVTQNNPLPVIVISGGTGGDGDMASLSATGIAANGQLGGSALPANSNVLDVIFRNTTGTSVDVSLGTTLGGSDIMAAVTVPGNGTYTAGLSDLILNWFGLNTPQSIFVTSASWGGASVNVKLIYTPGA